MIITKTKRKVIIVKLHIDELKNYEPCEIKLPANVKRVTGIAVTATVKPGIFP